MFSPGWLIKHLARGQHLGGLIVNREAVTAFEDIAHDEAGIGVEMRGRLRAGRHRDFYHLETPVVGGQFWQVALPRHAKWRRRSVLRGRRRG